MKSGKNQEIRHGEAVGIGMLCEIYYSEGNSHKFKLLEKILRFYNLPTNLKYFKNKKSKSLVDQIYKSIFLDKKESANIQDV